MQLITSHQLLIKNFPHQKKSSIQFLMFKNSLFDEDLCHVITIHCHNRIYQINCVKFRNAHSSLLEHQLPL